MSARHLFAALAVSLCGAGAATAQSAPAKPALIGVHEFNIAPQGQLPGRVALLNKIGAQVVRLPVAWHLMEEGGKGRTAAWFWKGLDADVAAAEQAGVQLIIELALTPCWASSDPSKQCDNPAYDGFLRYPPTDAADYGDALARLVKRYGTRVMAWEVWNEPNLVGNWLPLGPRPHELNDDDDMFIDLDGARQYAGLLAAAHARVKAVDPHAVVLAGSVAGGDVAFVQALYAAGAAGHFDALSMHPYTGPYPDPDKKNYGQAFGPDECPAGVREPKFWCFQLGVERIRQAMLAQGDDKPIWFTEFGFSSTRTWNGSGLAGQARHLEAAIALIRQWPFVPVACWYNLVDLPGGDERETRFGLVDRRGALKPAGRALRALLKP